MFFHYHDAISLFTNKREQKHRLHRVYTGIRGLWTQELDAGLLTLDSGLWTLDVGRWALDAGRWTLDAEC